MDKSHGMGTRICIGSSTRMSEDKGSSTRMSEGKDPLEWSFDYFNRTLTRPEASTFSWVSKQLSINGNGFL